MESVVVVVLLLWCLISRVGGSKFEELFSPSWSNQHVVKEGDLLKLKLDQTSGAGFASKSKYLFGKVTAEIKLVPGDSAGTVTAFYMSSEGEKHNEFDFEFLGNTTGNPYLVQTNVYVNGVGNREERLDLWFDPTADFHSYSLRWSPNHVIFSVDDTPVRVFKNKESNGVPFPKDQPMGVYSSIWNADDWATQGGRVKTDWTHAPFVTTFREFQVITAGDRSEVGILEDMTVHQSHQLMWVRAHHLVYDYCWDTDRFPVTPVECRRS